MNGSILYLALFTSISLNAQIFLRLFLRKLQQLYVEDTQVKSGAMKYILPLFFTDRGAVFRIWPDNYGQYFSGL